MITTHRGGGALKSALVFLMAFAGVFLGPSYARAEGLQVEPIKCRVGYSDERGSYCQIDSSLELESGWLRVEVDGKFDWPKFDQKLQLTLNGIPKTAWDWLIRGYVGREERYDLGEAGYTLSYEGGPFGCQISGKNYLKKLRVLDGPDYGRKDLYTRVSGDWHGENGQRLRGEIAFYDKDYKQRVEYTSDKRNGKLEYQFYAGKNKYTLTYTESSADYPQSMLKNYFSQGCAAKWQLSQANRGKWEVKTSYESMKKGDGTKPESIGLELARTMALGPGELYCRMKRSWKGDVAWIEFFTDEEETATGAGTGYQSVDLTWKRRFGPKNAWLVQGELKDYDDGFLGWKLKTQRDWKLGNLFFQIQLFYHHNKDGKNAGSWLQTTYYFK